MATYCLVEKAMGQQKGGTLYLYMVFNRAYDRFLRSRAGKFGGNQFVKPQARDACWQCTVACTRESRTPDQN